MKFYHQTTRPKGDRKGAAGGHLNPEGASKPYMTALGRIRKLGLALAVILIGLNARALPVKPNLEKILKQQEQPPHQYEPARAGWDGPEMVRPQEASPNPVYETYGPASSVRAIRAALKAAATPDPAAIVAIGMLILLWRIARNERTRREAAVLVMPRSEVMPHSGESRAA